MSKNLELPIILASASPIRAELLKKMRIGPFEIFQSNIDETPLSKELPRDLVKRLARLKLEAVLSQIDQGYILCADTVSALGRRILPKAANDTEVKDCLNMLSGRRHRVYTGIAIAKKTDTQVIVKQKLAQTVVKFKRLSDEEINFYIDSKEGVDKAGGYNIFGVAECFIEFVSGPVSNVGGLPLLETKNLLSSLGFKFWCR